MKKITNYRSDLVLVAALIVAVIGFRLVTQAGQQGVIMQNDGYAVSGGIVLIIAGVLFGQWFIIGRK